MQRCGCLSRLGMAMVWGVGTALPIACHLFAAIDGSVCSAADAFEGFHTSNSCESSVGVHSG
eukprot:878630-Karenia_brevis.AAC.1